MGRRRKNKKHRNTVRGVNAAQAQKPKKKRPMTVAQLLAACKKHNHPVPPVLTENEQHVAVYMGDHFAAYEANPDAQRLIKYINEAVDVHFGAKPKKEG